MIALKLVKTTSDKINTLYHATGQLIYCTDTKKSYFDHEDGSRYSDIDDNLVIGEVRSDFDNTKSTIRFFNKVYIDLSEAKFYKYNFDKLEFELIYTDNQFMDIIKGTVALVPATVEDDDKQLAPVSLASNVYYSEDGLTTLEEMLNKDLYITTVKCKYVEATIDGQRVFKIPFPVSKYSLYRDHMNVVAESYNPPILTPEDYKVNCGYLVINPDKPGIPKGEKIYFLFYYSRTTNNSQSQSVGTDNLLDGCITIEKLSPYIEIPAEYILQTDDLQFVNKSDKEVIEKMRNFKITELDADVITENEDRMFVTETMFRLLESILDPDGDGDDKPENPDDPLAGFKYVHPATHEASMIIIRRNNKDLEQYIRELEEIVLPNKVSYNDGTIETPLDDVYIPGNYTVLLNNLKGLPIQKIGNLHVSTSDGKEFTGLESTWIVQEYECIDDTDSDNPILRIFKRFSNQGNKKWGDWIEVLTSTNNVKSLNTNAKDIIGAINEVFQFANDIKSKWQNVIGYPLDNYDSVANLYEKTVNIKKKLADILTKNGIDAFYTQPLQELVNLTTHIGDNNKVRTGLLRSSTTTKTFEDSDGSTFNEFYIEIETLGIPVGIVNVYSPDGSLHCTFKNDGVGLYSVGKHNNVFVQSDNGAYIGAGFRVPVEEKDTNYRYYATPMSS